MNMSFEWDPKKAATNQRKHGVPFEEAIVVFGDPLARIFDGPDHSDREQREIIIGHATGGQLLVVCFVQRAERLRIFSARRATHQERRNHEEGTS
jgi:uncharacterized DUF497 family protein